jgi:VanZ family protein
VWTLFATAWSIALLVPIPIHPGPGLRTPEVLFTVAKATHVSAYALFAILTLWLPLRGGLRWGLVGLLPCHGAVTEFLQWSFPSLGRTGSVRDVIIDVVGISLGLGLWFWWHRRQVKATNPNPTRVLLRRAQQPRLKRRRRAQAILSSAR